MAESVRSKLLSAVTEGQRDGSTTTHAITTTNTTTTIATATATATVKATDPTISTTIRTVNTTTHRQRTTKLSAKRGRPSLVNSNVNSKGEKAQHQDQSEQQPPEEIQSKEQPLTQDTSANRKSHLKNSTKRNSQHNILNLSAPAKLLSPTPSSTTSSSISNDRKERKRYHDQQSQKDVDTANQGNSLLTINPADSVIVTPPKRRRHQNTKSLEDLNKITLRRINKTRGRQRNRRLSDTYSTVAISGEHHEDCIAQRTRSKTHLLLEEPSTSVAAYNNSNNNNSFNSNTNNDTISNKTSSNNNSTVNTRNRTSRWTIATTTASNAANSTATTITPVSITSEGNITTARHSKTILSSTVSQADTGIGSISNVSIISTPNKGNLLNYFRKTRKLSHSRTSSSPLFIGTSSSSADIKSSTRKSSNPNLNLNSSQYNRLTTSSRRVTVAIDESSSGNCSNSNSNKNSSTSLRQQQQETSSLRQLKLSTRKSTNSRLVESRNNTKLKNGSPKRRRQRSNRKRSNHRIQVQESQQQQQNLLDRHCNQGTRPGTSCKFGPYITSVSPSTSSSKARSINNSAISAPSGNSRHRKVKATVRTKKSNKQRSQQTLTTAGNRATRTAAAVATARIENIATSTAVSPTIKSPSTTNLPSQFSTNSVAVVGTSTTSISSATTITSTSSTDQLNKVNRLKRRFTFARFFSGSLASWYNNNKREAGGGGRSGRRSGSRSQSDRSIKHTNSRSLSKTVSDTAVTFTENTLQQTLTSACVAPISTTARATETTTTTSVAAGSGIVVNTSSANSSTVSTITTRRGRNSSRSNINIEDSNLNTAAVSTITTTRRQQSRLRRKPLHTLNQLEQQYNTVTAEAAPTISVTSNQNETNLLDQEEEEEVARGRGTTAVPTVTNRRKAGHGQDRIITNSDPTEPEEISELVLEFDGYEEYNEIEDDGDEEEETIREDNIDIDEEDDDDGDEDIEEEEVDEDSNDVPYSVVAAIEEEMSKRKQNIDKLTCRIKWAKNVLTEWQEAMDAGNRGYQLIEMYYKDDQLKAKEQNLKLQHAHKEIDKARQYLVNLYNEQKTLECNLECTASLYRTGHAERRQMVETWKSAVTQMTQREHDIRQSEMTLIDLQMEDKRKKNELMHMEKILNDMIDNNKQVEMNIEELNNETSQMKEQIQMLADMAILKANEVETLQKEIQMLSHQVERQRAQNRRTKAMYSERLGQIKVMNAMVEDLERKFKDKQTRNLSAAQRLEQLEEIMDEEEKMNKAISKEADRINSLIYRAENELVQFKNDNKTLQVFFEGLKGTIMAVTRNTAKLRNQMKLQTQMQYELSFKILNIERDIINLQGGFKDPETEEKNRLYLIYLEDQNVKMTKNLQSTLHQNNKLNDDMRKLTLLYDNDHHELDQINNKIEEAEAYYEGGVKRVREVTQQNQELIVELSLLKMRAREFENDINECDEGTYNLVKHRIHLQRTIKDRMIDLKSQMELLQLKRKHLNEELSTLRADIGERTKHIEAVKARFELTSKLLGVNDDGTLITATQLRVETAQEKQMLLDEGNELNERVLKAEEEIKALENTLALFNNANDKFRQSSKENKDNEANKKELKSLQLTYCNYLEQLKQLRVKYNEIHKRIEESIKERDSLEKTLANIEEKKNENEAYLRKLQSELNEQELKLQRAERDLKLAMKATRQRATISAEFLELFDRDLDLKDLAKRNMNVLNQLAEIVENDFQLGPEIGRYLRSHGLKLPHTLQKSCSSLSWRSSTTSDISALDNISLTSSATETEAQSSQRSFGVSEESKLTMSVVSLNFPETK